MRGDCFGKTLAMTLGELSVKGNRLHYDMALCTLMVHCTLSLRTKRSNLSLINKHYPWNAKRNVIKLRII